MSFDFEWNAFADQPHNVAPKSERWRHHLRHAGSYFEIAGSNLRRALPVLRGYRGFMKNMHRSPVAVGDAFGCAVSPAGPKDAATVALLSGTGVRHALIRAASWERGRLPDLESFVRAVRETGVDVCLALLQRRADVLDPPSWRGFLEEVFGRFAPLVAAFEIGHAWNRTKWGVWDHREYRALAEAAFELAPRPGPALAGPAVIDFEFHLYPVTLPRLPFDKVTSLLYVDRMGAPENAQCGWTAVKKLALLKAVVDATSRAGKDVWITEVNWPLAGTEPYSPAAGRPNVGEEEQADYLVRYYVPGLASGLAERIYWWQLAAPGYGLVDTRAERLRPRPSYHAFRELRARLEGSRFDGREGAAGAEIFHFRKDGLPFAVCWTAGAPAEHVFRRPVDRIFDRGGREIAGRTQRLIIDGSPKYVIFRE